MHIIGKHYATLDDNSVVYVEEYFGQVDSSCLLCLDASKEIRDNALKFVKAKLFSLHLDDNLVSINSTYHATKGNDHEL